MSKGSAPRPMTNREAYYNSWERTFGDEEKPPVDDSGIVFTCIPVTQDRPMLVQIYRGAQWWEGADLSAFGKILKLFHVGNPEEGRAVAQELRRDM